MERLMSKEDDGAQEVYGREREVETLRAPGPTGTIETPVEHLDLATVIKEREAKSRRLVEAQTQQAEDELRAIIDNAPVFLWSDLPDGYCDFLNQRFRPIENFRRSRT
jgi:PAS domain-containing protein